MFELDSVLMDNPYSLCDKDKQKSFLLHIKSLTKHHYDNSVYYNRILNHLKYNIKNDLKLSQLPFIPVRLFKYYDLISVNKHDIFKQITSSGTTSNNVSNIYLNKETAELQTRVLTKIITNVTGNKRLPLLIIDTENTVSDRKNYSARGAGILGFSLMGKDVTFALDQNMELNIDVVMQFINKYKDKPKLIFGFTYIVWSNLVQYLYKNKINLTFVNTKLIHGGGWKKITDLNITSVQFKDQIKKQCGINKVINYYGMVEQTGSIFIECDSGYFHTTNFSDITVRRNDFSECDYGENGIVQLYSLLPRSYPGHIILTEDEGVIYGEDDCLCGKYGKYFLITGRVKKAEIRGCSDVYS